MTTYNPSAPVYLIDDLRMSRSGWDYDNRGSGEGKPSFWATKTAKSVNRDFPTVFKHPITRQTCGSVTYECNFRMVSGDGLFMRFCDGDDAEEEAFSVAFRGGNLVCGTKNVCKAPLGKHHIRFILDISRGEAEIYFNGRFCGTYRFTGSARAIAAFCFGYGKEDLGETVFSSNDKMYKNFLVNDGCIYDEPGDLPDDYDTELFGNAKVFRRNYVPDKEETVYTVKAAKGAGAAVSHGFARTEGKLAFEIKYYLPKKNGRVTVTMGQGKTDVITLWDELTALCCEGGVLREHQYNVWQWLRLDADTVSKTVTVRLNGKKLTVLPFADDASFLDRITLRFNAGKTASEVMFDYIKVYRLLPEPADYVPEPVIPKKKGPECYVGMNICSMWRGGHHFGWDCISPFAEAKPLLGFYDEGSPEVADWEIKWMSEHGIDFELYCWYATQNNAPFKETRNDSAWMAHFTAKYSDKVKFALLWEANSMMPDSEAFRKYFVPYWLDYYFSDDRYMTIDGYAIMSIFAPHRLMQFFGSAEKVKEEFDFLRSEVRKLGYRDLIVMCCGVNSDVFRQCGLDAGHAYNWGSLGYDLEYTKKQVMENIRAGYTHYVPTVSTGYNIAPWTGFRFPNMTPSDMKATLTWCRETCLPMFEEGTWKRKLVMLSTWNEYGEGTFICPAGLNGFGYLDAVRSVFCEDLPHKDVIPDAHQLARINILHPQDRGTVAPLDHEPADTADRGALIRYTFRTQEDLDKWEFHGFSKLELRDGVLYGESEGEDPYMLLKDPDALPLRAGRVRSFRVRMRGWKEENRVCCAELRYSLAPDGTISENTRRRILTNPDALTDMEFQVRRIRGLPWHDSVTALRFDPIYAAGGFELESFEITATDMEYELYADGRYISLAQDLEEADGELYLPFDTTSSLVSIPQMYYEYRPEKQQLILWSREKNVFTVGADTAQLGDRTVRLARPVRMKDGSPMLPLSVFAEILGMTVTADGKTIRLDTVG